MNPKNKEYQFPTNLIMMDEIFLKYWKMTQTNSIQPLEFSNIDHETGSQHKSQTWKNNNVKLITN